MIEGERYSPSEPVEVSDNLENPQSPTDLQPVEEMLGDDLEEAMTHGDPGATFRPDIGPVGVDNVPVHKPPDGIQEKPHGGAQKPSFDSQPLDTHNIQPTSTDLTDEVSTKQLLDEMDDMSEALDQQMQADLAAWNERPRPVYMDVKPLDENISQAGYIDPGDYEIDYSLLDNVTDEKQQFFTQLLEPEMDLESDFEVEQGMDAAASEVELLETKIDLTEEADLAKVQEEHLRFGELESDQDYEINGYHYETDEVGRVEYVSGKLELGEAVRDLQEQGRVGREGVEGDEGGHFIGARFAGSPEGINLFPQDMNLNRGQWKAMENEWDRAVQRGAEVETIIHSVYEGDDKRPMGLDVLYTIDGVTHQRSFVNAPRGQLL